MREKLTKLALTAGIVALTLQAVNAQAINIAVTSDILSADPTLDTTPPAVNIYQNVYDQLTEIKPDGSLGPRLATSWQANDDATVWTFTIRKDAKFHDGSALTTDDIVWTVKKVLSETKSPTRIFFAKVKEVEKDGDDKVRFTLSEPSGVFDRQLIMLHVLPGKVYEKLGAQQFNQTPVGSGPYKLVRWVKDDRIELEAFPGYWRGTPNVVKAAFKPIPSESSRVAALLSGEIDLVTALPPVQVERIGAMSGMKVEKVLNNRVTFLGFNTSSGPLADVKIRQAINHAIDRNAITNRLLRGYGQPIGSMIPASTFGYDKNLAVAKYDPEQSRKLLKEANYNGERIVFEFPTTNLLQATDIAQAITGYLNAVGINVDMRPSEYTSFFPSWTQRKMQGMYMTSYASSLFDGDSQASGLFETGSRSYKYDPRIDEAAKLQRRSGSAATRSEEFAKMLKIVADEVIYAPLFNEAQGYGYRTNIGKWTPRADGQVRLIEIDR